ncbi:MAG TPA: hypothetical protein VMU50_02625 [Polyangia bacterium]|nr:hypothetical protein [Polyangia bacterium]
MLAGSAPARAAEVTRVVSGFDQGNHLDINGSISWLHEIRRGYIKRESETAPTTPTSAGQPTQTGTPQYLDPEKDLAYLQTRDVLNLRVDVGVFWDLGFHIEAPLVLHDARSLDFDQSASGCVYPGSGTRPTCVNSQNSTLLRDGILPGYMKNSYGLDAQHNRPFDAPSSTVFRGPNRSGLESLNLGLTWAAFNQARDDTKPTWTLGFDAKLDVGGDMRFDPANPGGNTGVGLGYHQLVWSTVVSRRFRYFDPYFGLWYMLPARTSGGPFQDYGNAQLGGPQQQLGLQIGFEQIAWEVPQSHQRVTIEFRGHATEHLKGRAQTPLWEALSGSSKCPSEPTQCRTGIDGDLNGDGKPDPYPGVTDVQAYASLGGNVGVNVQVGPHVRFRALGGLATDLPHFITYASSGSASESGASPGKSTTPTNPVYREVIDLPGRRFRVEGSEIWSLFVEGMLLF